jgi:hypothetical protein
MKPGTFVRPVAPENREAFEDQRAAANARVQHELLRLRAGERPVPPWENQDAYAYDKTIAETHLKYVQAWRPDPKRRVLTHWKKLMIQQRGGIVSISYEADGKLSDASLFAAEKGPFKIRWLHGSKAGQVEDVPPESYLAFRKGPGQTTVAEPVPDDEPLCPPAQPANMPSCFLKAQRLVAKKLKKAPEDITYAEALDFFHKRLAAETF